MVPNPVPIKFGPGNNPPNLPTVGNVQATDFTAPVNDDFYMMRRFVNICFGFSGISFQRALAPIIRWLSEFVNIMKIYGTLVGNNWEGYTQGMNATLSIICRNSFLYGGVNFSRFNSRHQWTSSDTLDDEMYQPYSAMSLLWCMKGMDLLGGIKYVYNQAAIIDNPLSDDRAIGHIMSWMFLNNVIFHNEAIVNAPPAGSAQELLQRIHAYNYTNAIGNPANGFCTMPFHYKFGRTFRFERSVQQAKANCPMSKRVSMLLATILAGGNSMLKEMKLPLCFDNTFNSTLAVNGVNIQIRNVFDDANLQNDRGTFVNQLLGSYYKPYPHLAGIDILFHPVICKYLRCHALWLEATTSRYCFGVSFLFSKCGNVTMASGVLRDAASDVNNDNVANRPNNLVLFGFTGNGIPSEVIADNLVYNWSFPGSIPNSRVIYDDFRNNVYYAQILAAENAGLPIKYNIPIPISTTMITDRNFLPEYQKDEYIMVKPFSWEKGRPYIDIDSVMVIGMVKERFVRTQLPNTLYNDPDAPVVTPHYALSLRYNTEADEHIDYLLVRVPNRFANLFKLLTPSDWAKK